MAKANKPVEPVAPELEQNAPVEPVAPTAPKSKKSTQVGSVMLESIGRVEDLLDSLKENQRVVGSDIAQKELATCVASAEEIFASLNRAILADR